MSSAFLNNPAFFPTPGGPLPPREPPIVLPNIAPVYAASANSNAPAATPIAMNICPKVNVPKGVSIGCAKTVLINSFIATYSFAILFRNSALANKLSVNLRPPIIASAILTNNVIIPFAISAELFCNNFDAISKSDRTVLNMAPTTEVMMVPSVDLFSGSLMRLPKKSDIFEIPSATNLKIFLIICVIDADISESLRRSLRKFAPFAIRSDMPIMIDLNKDLIPSITPGILRSLDTPIAARPNKAYLKILDRPSLIVSKKPFLSLVITFFCSAVGFIFLYFSP